MIHKKIIILGAGPSGLTLAHALIDYGYKNEDIVLIEAQSMPGGLCRSEWIDGAPVDIGGGHFLDFRRENVLKFLFRFMPQNEWKFFKRISKIRIRGMEIDYPFEANLWQFPIEFQADCLESITKAGSIRGEVMPDKFGAWIPWKFGERISREYMLPYNRKIWSMALDELGSYWLYKLPDISFREILLSCLKGCPIGDLRLHTGRFYIPSISATAKCGAGWETPLETRS